MIAKKIYNLLDRIMLIRAKNGPYHFLVKHWYKLSSATLAQSLLDTEYFKETLEPIQPNLNDLKSVLVLAPHQDDEIIGAGGLILQLLKQGIYCKIVFVTDGGLSNFPGGLEQSIKIRNKEARLVCEKMNIDHEFIGLNNHTMQVQIYHFEKLLRIIEDQKPNVILSPWILDFPPKHKVVNHLLSLALKNYSGNKPAIWGYQVHNVLFPNVVLDISNEINAKMDLLRLYKSQNELYAPYDHLTFGMNAWNARFLVNSNLGVKKSFVECFFALPTEDYSKLVDRFYNRDLPSTYAGNAKVLTGITNFLTEFKKSKYRL